MTRTFVFALALAVPLLASAQSGRQQYISDEITLSVREAPRGDAGTIAVVRSGERVTLLQSLGPESFARIRTADGTVGWVTARYLSSEPAAKDQLAQARKELAETRGRVQTLEQEIESSRRQLATLRPAHELSQENDRLRAAIAEHERASEELQRRYDVEKAHRRTLVTGAGLVGAGVLTGLLLPWLGRGKRRRYSEL